MFLHSMCSWIISCFAFAVLLFCLYQYNYILPRNHKRQNERNQKRKSKTNELVKQRPNKEIVTGKNCFNTQAKTKIPKRIRDAGLRQFPQYPSMGTQHDREIRYVLSVLEGLRFFVYIFETRMWMDVGGCS